MRKNRQVDGDDAVATLCVDNGIEKGSGSGIIDSKNVDGLAVANAGINGACGVQQQGCSDGDNAVATIRCGDGVVERGISGDNISENYNCVPLTQCGVNG